MGKGRALANRPARPFGFGDTYPYELVWIQIDTPPSRC